MMATGKQVSQVAKEHGFSKVHFYRTIKKENRSMTVRNIIASITDLSIEELWPETDNQKMSSTTPP